MIMWHDGVDLSNHIQILDVKGRSLSPNEIDSHELYKGGYRFRRRRKKPVPLEVEAVLILKSDIELRSAINELNGILDTEEPVPIVFSDEPEFTYDGILNTISEGTEIRGKHFVTLTFWRPEPYKYKTAHELAIDSAFKNFEIQSQAKTPWTSQTVFETPASQFVLETNDGGKIVLNYEFVAGDTLYIDYKSRKVTLNNENLMVALSIKSNWFDLKPGFMEIRASHTTTVSYKERYY